MQGKALARGSDCGGPTGGLYEKLKPGPGKNAAQVAVHQRARIHSAMLDLVAENGYEAVTVRDLARAAGVSTRSFYKHYSSKEQCFLLVLQLVIQRAHGLFGLPQECTSGKRIRLLIETAVGALVSEPKAARLLCVDAYTAGPVALRHAESGRRSIEMAIDKRFTEKPSASKPSLVAEAVVAGVYSAIRGYHLEERELPFAFPRETLVPWMTSSCEGFLLPGELAKVPCLNEVEVNSSAKEIANGAQSLGPAESPEGDRMALLKAATKLAVTESDQTLKLAKLVKAAGVSRRTFHANFASLEECLLRALEIEATDTMACVREAAESGLTPEEGVYRAVSTLCRQIDGDKAFATHCLHGSVAPGMPRMRFQQSVIDKLTAVIADRLEATWCVNRPTVRVAAGSVWGMIENHVTSDSANGLLQKAPTFTYLLLAPIIEPAAVMETVDQDYALTT
jgi:AcrR family transcriptional regulator